MSLTNCPECGAEISDKAAACPHCGHPINPTQPTQAKPEKKHGCLVMSLIIVGAVAMITLIGGQNHKPSNTSISTTTQNEPDIDRSAATQAKRKAFIEKLIAKGVFSKIETPGNLPRAWVRPAFYALDYDTKKSFCNAVLTYYYAQDSRYDILRLFDSRTNKEVGKFSFVTGTLDLE